MGALRHRGLPFDDRGALGSSGGAQSRSGRPFGRVGVVYGGPSPEHDVSILTGLQAVRCLAGMADVDEVCSLYWSKAGEWFDVPTGLEPAAFVAGPRPTAAPFG